MLKKGDKIKLVKPVPNLEVGKVYEITNITEDGYITFNFKYGMCAMSYKEYETYFEDYIKSEWTDWHYRRLDNDEPIKVLLYRTNNKSVEVKAFYNFPTKYSENNYIKARATCHREDDFNLEKGIELAYKRLVCKIYEQDMEIICDKLHKQINDYLKLKETM